MIEWCNRSKLNGHQYEIHWDGSVHQAVNEFYLFMLYMYLIKILIKGKYMQTYAGIKIIYTSQGTPHFFY